MNYISTFLRVMKGNKRMYHSGSKDDVLFEIKNKCGLITLNRPKQLNCLNLPMMDAIRDTLKKWDNQISMVVIRGNDNAFCAGADVKILGEYSFSCWPMLLDLFKKDYENDYLIANYKHPFISIIDGYTFGSGAGLAMNGKYQVATERTIFAMPETAIGLFPDAGSSYYLSRLPGNLGVFLGLTGHRLNGVDVNKLGLASHYCSSNDLSKIVDSLVAISNNPELLENTLGKFSKNVSLLPFSLEDKRQIIERIFGLSSVEEIFKALGKEGSDWSKNVLDTLKKMSPTALVVTLREMNLGKSMSLKECLQMEYNITSRAIEAEWCDDAYNGPKALLVDKTVPKWYPSKLESVQPEYIDTCFQTGDRLDFGL